MMRGHSETLPPRFVPVGAGRLGMGLPRPDWVSIPVLGFTWCVMFLSMGVGEGGVSHKPL